MRLSVRPTIVHDRFRRWNRSGRMTPLGFSFAVPTSSARINIRERFHRAKYRLDPSVPRHLGTTPPQGAPGPQLGGLGRPVPPRWPGIRRDRGRALRHGRWHGYNPGLQAELHANQVRAGCPGAGSLDQRRCAACDRRAGRRHAAHHRPRSGRRRQLADRRARAGKFTFPVSGGAAGASYAVDFSLVGDVDHNGTVNSADINAIARGSASPRRALDSCPAPTFSIRTGSAPPTFALPSPTRALPPGSNRSPSP